MKRTALILILALFVFAGLSGLTTSAHTYPTKTATDTKTPKPTNTPRPTKTLTPSITPTRTPTSTPTSTKAAQPTATHTPYCYVSGMQTSGGKTYYTWQCYNEWPGATKHWQAYLPSNLKPY